MERKTSWRKLQENFRALGYHYEDRVAKEGKRVSLAPTRSNRAGGED